MLVIIVTCIINGLMNVTILTASESAIVTSTCIHTGTNTFTIIILFVVVLSSAP